MTLLQEIFNNGGPLSYVIAGIFAISTFLFFHRFFYLHRINVNIDNFLLGLKNSLKNNREQKLVEAISLCDEARAPVGSMAKSILCRNTTSEAALWRAAEEAATVEVPRLQRNSRLIAALGQLAPLAGFLGTVLSLMTLFKEIGTGSNGVSMSISQMAPFVCNALITTALGIAVAMIIHLYNVVLQERCHSIVFDMEKTATELINFLVEPEDMSIKINAGILSSQATDDVAAEPDAKQDK